MKRSEALALIDKVYGDWVADVLRSNLETDNFIALNERILSALEQAGMYPPQAESKNNTEHFSMYVDNIDIPHWFTLGWDEE